MGLHLFVHVHQKTLRCAHIHQKTLKTMLTFALQLGYSDNRNVKFGHLAVAAEVLQWLRGRMAAYPYILQALVKNRQIYIWQTFCIPDGLQDCNGLIYLACHNPCSAMVYKLNP